MNGTAQTAALARVRAAAAAARGHAGDRRASSEVKRLALKQIAALDAKIAELQGMRRALQHLADHCQGDHRPDCPILDDLAEGAAA